MTQVKVVLAAALAWCCVLTVLAGPPPASARPAEGFVSRFVDPPAAFRPFYRYWHPGGRMDPATLRADFEAMREGGAGGVELVNFVRDNEIAPIEGYDPAVHGFGTPAWRTGFAAAQRIGRDKGLQVDALYTSKWSANLPTVSPDGRGSAKELSLATAMLDGGETYAARVPEPDLPDRVHKRQLVALRAYPCRENCGGSGLPVLDQARSVDLKPRLTTGRRLDWTAPGGAARWVLVASWLHGTGQLVEGAETAGDSFVVDHFSRDGFGAVRDFWTKRVLDPKVRSALAAGGGSLFFDSLELNRDGKQLRHWTAGFLREFKERRGYDLEPYIPALALRDPAFELPGDKGERVREDYRRTLQELFRDEHLLPLRAWAHQLGLTLRGQPYSSWGPSFADPIESSSLLDIPEGEDRSFNAGAGQDFIETQGADAYRSLATAAHVTGRPVVSTECCASFGRAHRVTRQELLSHLNQNFSAGANRVVWHGWSHDAPGTASTWPGWAAFGNTGVDDSYGPRNPTWADDRRINDYAARLQVALRAGKPRTDIAVYHQKPGHSAEGTVGERYFTSSALEDRGFTYGFVNASLLTGDDTPVAGKTLAPDGPRFRAFVLDDEEAVDLDVARRIVDMARRGLPVVVVGGAPSRATGNRAADDAAVRAAFEELRRYGNVRWVGREGDVPQALDDLGVQARAAFEKPSTLVGVGRSAKRSDTFYWYNASERRERATASVAADGIPYRLDPWTGAITRLPASVKDGRMRIDLDVAPGDVALVMVSDVPLDAAAAEAPRVADAGAGRPLSDWDLTVESWHRGTGPQDTVVTRLPKRRVTASDTDGRLPSWGSLDGLEAVSGVGTYRTTFDLDGRWRGRGAHLDLGEITTTYRVEVNGKDVGPVDQLDSSRIDIGPLLRPGENTIVVKVASMLGNAVAGKTVDDYGLIGPARLFPHS
ncbi:glycosyl hydrolase [Streptomyces boninensis]|uniref:glycosyl hydrolase n=1 Tax=Streptomyces boninensis TaxID=2039455 RepID=UPI003B217765